MTSTDDTAEVAVIIVAYNNADDVLNCLAALSRATPSPTFDIFICENGGREAYEQLIRRINGQVCPASAKAVAPGSFAAAHRLSLARTGSNVYVGCATDNLGYAGGVNAWLRPLMARGKWKGVWILNPDTEPDPDALAALVARAEAGDKGMVGSTILEAGSADTVRFRGGLSWRRLSARSVALGLGERLGGPIDLDEIERAMDSPSGASMYVTRRCIEEVGLMDDDYFLFFEDLDWGARAKALGLGYASASIVAHKRGTTTGSSGGSAGPSRLAIYLQNRNAIHFVRRHHPWTLASRVVVSTLFALRFLLQRAPRLCTATIAGTLAGLRGETGKPGWMGAPR